MTSQQMLFEEDDQITPLEAYTEPHVWIRRLVIVDKLAANATILRRVHFRRGINIITTEPRQPDDTKPVGHSVGKSLLIRLIRYCLGDSQYCTDNLRKKVVSKLENAYVLATFRIAGNDWVVARPLGLEFGSRNAWCAQSRHLRELFTENRHPYGDFLAAINGATSKCYAEIELPQASRRAEWKDLLGWLCRDQDCHFSHHAEWRYHEAESGPRVLSREDAYLVMRMAMGLLGPEETGLIADHRQRLKQNADAQKELTELQPHVNYAESQWRRMLPELAQSPLAGSIPDALEDMAQEKQQSLKRLLDAEMNHCRKIVDSCHNQANELAKQRGVVEQELKQLQNDRTAQQAILDGLQSDAAGQAMQSLGTGGFDCPFYDTQAIAFAAGCPGKTALNLPLASPERTVCINACQGRITGIETRIRECLTRVGNLDAKVTSAQEKLANAQNTLQQLHEKLPVEIGAWKNRESLAKDLKQARAALIRKQNELPKFAARVEESKGLLAASRDRLGKSLNELSRYYTILLRRTITPDADGTVTVDGNGLHPEPGLSVADSGTTLREYADVLSFDVACLTAAVCGFGHLPRLWMHDSPRQADSEEQLYHSLLRFLRDLEASYPNGTKPSFQYILTTTSAPPAELNIAPYVRLRLHARQPSGKLLRIDFGK